MDPFLSFVFIVWCRRTHALNIASSTAQRKIRVIHCMPQTIGLIFIIIRGAAAGRAIRFVVGVLVTRELVMSAARPSGCGHQDLLSLREHIVWPIRLHYFPFDSGAHHRSIGWWTKAVSGEHTPQMRTRASSTTSWEKLDERHFRFRIISSFSFNYLRVSSFGGGVFH